MGYVRGWGRVTNRRGVEGAPEGSKGRVLVRRSKLRAVSRKACGIATLRAQPFVEKRRKRGEDIWNFPTYSLRKRSVEIGWCWEDIKAKTLALRLAPVVSFENRCPLRRR